jgi:two-component sensor histidine kinase
VRPPPLHLPTAPPPDLHAEDPEADRLQVLEARVAHLEAALEARSVHLLEVHHRVKNNLQIVASLLGMQADRAEPRVRGALVESVQRVRAMALIHQALHMDAGVGKIDFGRYVESLLAQLEGATDSTVAAEVVADRVEVPVDQAIPCGLIVNELVTNALKHGRSPDGRCRLSIEVRGTKAGFAILVGDRGRGVPSDFEQRQRQSLGVQVVRALVRQLSATLTVSGERGAHFTIAVPSREPHPVPIPSPMPASVRGGPG